MRSTFTQLTDPDPNEIAESLTTWLSQLQGPTRIDLTGEDSSRRRVLVTLLHGNEPSGVRAVHRWLRQGKRPATDVTLVLGSVESAMLEPNFRFRSYPGARDLNRCFNPPFDDPSGEIARQILEIIDQPKVEAVLDLHNTSGKSPSFAVATAQTYEHEWLTQLFTEKLVVTELRLGSLMEQTSSDRPVLTVECGGAEQQSAHDLAWQGLCAFLTCTQLFDQNQALDLDLYHHPVRLELKEGLTLAFADAPALGVELTLLSDVDRFNFQSVSPGTLIGWVRNEQIRDRLRVTDAQGLDRFDRYFEICGNQLQTRSALKLFMVTTRPDIALSDCLLYAAFESETEHLHLNAGKSEVAH